MRRFTVRFLTAMLLTLAVVFPAQAKVTLKVSMYAWLPDYFDQMIGKLEKDFELANSDVDVVINSQECTPDPYVVKNLQDQLTKPIAGGGVHIVEMDAVMLGEARGWAQPVDAKDYPGDWHAAGLANASVKGTAYGVPHWLCGNFVISKSKDVAEAKDRLVLMQALIEARKGEKSSLLGGDFTGSWTTPSLYLLTWQEDNPQGDAQAQVYEKIDAGSAQELLDVSSWCKTEKGANPCTCADYHNDLDALLADYMGAGLYGGIVGFSETMHSIVKSLGKAENYYITPAAFGNSKIPMLYTDVFVQRKGMSDEEADAAKRFLQYATSPGTMAWCLMANQYDGGGTYYPLYVIPARMETFAQEGLKDDVYYQRIKDAIAGGKAFPNCGLPGNKDRLDTELKPYLPCTR